MKLLLLFLLLFVNSIIGQVLLLDELPLIDSKVTYKKVNEVLDHSKINLCAKAGDWFHKEVIVLDVDKPLDGTHHYLSGTYRFKTLWGPNNYKELYKEIECTVSLTVKNERYQYEFSDFIVREPNQVIQLEIYQLDHKKFHKYNKAFYKRVDTEIKDVLAKLEKTMTL